MMGLLCVQENHSDVISLEASDPGLVKVRDIFLYVDNCGTNDGATAFKMYLTRSFVLL